MLWFDSANYGGILYQDKSEIEANAFTEDNGNEIKDNLSTSKNDLNQEEEDEYDFLDRINRTTIEDPDEDDPQVEDAMNQQAHDLKSKDGEGLSVNIKSEWNIAKYLPQAARRHFQSVIGKSCDISIPDPNPNRYLIPFHFIKSLK